MDTQEILKKCTVDGNIVRLPQIQLDRKQYLEVKKSLELIGGKWKGGNTQGFIFDINPSELLAQIADGEKRNLKKEFQFFATPATLADRLVKLAELNETDAILEPSAGQGAIINAINRIFPEKTIDCYELMPTNQIYLSKIPTAHFIGSDFLENDAEYDKIIANPPFAKNQDIEHVYKMYDTLKEGGRLVSVMSNHWRNCRGKKEDDFNAFIHHANAYVEDIAEGEFKESGTNVSACIVVIKKSVDKQAPKFTKKEKSSKIDLDIKKQINKNLQQITNPTGAKRQFEASFNKFLYRHSQSEVFCDFLDYTLLAMKWWESARDFSYFEKKYGELYPEFLNMLTLLSEASEGMQDALGDLFMDLVSHGRNGQFFTPENICTMMSHCSGIETLTAGQTVSDTACGSGRMLLAAAKVNRDILLFGNDNDVTCCKMAAINLIINSLSGEIALMDSLKMEYVRSWKTDTKIVAGVHLPIYIEITDKEQSLLYQMTTNSIKSNAQTRAENPIEIIPETKHIPKQRNIHQLQLELF